MIAKLETFLTWLKHKIRSIDVNRDKPNVFADYNRVSHHSAQNMQYLTKELFSFHAPNGVHPNCWATYTVDFQVHEHFKFTPSGDFVS